MRPVQVVLFLALVAALAWVLLSSVDGWADWVVLAAMVLTVLGAAIAVYPRRYTGRRRTFVRHSGPPPGGPPRRP